jgi:thioredoxin 1
MVGVTDEREEKGIMNRVFSGLTIVCLLLALTAAPSSAAEQRINMQALMAQRVPVLLEFGRGWCIPCKYMKPILEDMTRLYAGKAIVTTVDMDANKDLVRDFRIRMMPTQVFLGPDGKEFFRNEGTLEREHIVQIFAKMGVPQPALPPGPAAAAPAAPTGRGGPVR